MRSSFCFLLFALLIGGSSLAFAQDGGAGVANTIASVPAPPSWLAWPIYVAKAYWVYFALVIYLVADAWLKSLPADRVRANSPTELIANVVIAVFGRVPLVRSLATPPTEREQRMADNLPMGSPNPTVKL